MFGLELYSFPLDFCHNGGGSQQENRSFLHGKPVSNPIETSGFGSIQMSEKSDILNKQMEDMMSKRELDVPNVPARI